MDAQPGLAGKVIIVTGAGKGLGRAYAIQLGRSGAKVIVNNRWRDRAEPSSADAVVAEIAAAGGQAIASHHAADEPASGEAMVALAQERFGRLDGVLANAGVPESATFGRQTLADVHGVFDTNFFGTLHIVHAAWKIMLAQKYGRVVVSTSSAGLHGNHGMPAYSASKAALIGLMRALSLEGARANVRVNALAPSAATPMTSGYLSDDVARRMPPEGVAPLAAWLMSEACDISGEVLVAGAGRLRRARALEGPVVAFGSNVGAAVHAAVEALPNVAFTHANAAWDSYMTAVPN